MNNTEKEQIEIALKFLSKERVNVSGLGAPINVLKRLLEDSNILDNQNKTDKIPLPNKQLIVKLESYDPTGIAIKSERLMMGVIDDPEAMKKDRLFISIGECMYRIDNKGFIIDRIIPHENNKIK